MRRIALVLLVSTVAAAAVRIGASTQAIANETVRVDGASHRFLLFIPETIGPDPVPLLLVFHGSGGHGRSALDPWRDTASRERFIVAAPEAIDRGSWQTPEDGPAALYAVVESVKQRHAIDGRRMYLFGHSAGAWFAVTMSLLESEYFAATAVHAGGLQPGGRDQLLGAPRKIPIAIFVGTDDQVVPPRVARETRNTLSSNSFPVTLVEIAGHDHNYAAAADRVNRDAWEFLRSRVLADEPRFQQYRRR
jgi:poly(3-hydroxybutyrate) depolymerase